MAPDNLSAVGTDTPFTWLASSVGELRRIANSWLTTPELHVLIETVGGLDANQANDHEALRAWSSEHLDTRRHAERRDAPAATFPEPIRSRLFDAGRALGLLTTPSASTRNYRTIIILGGATTGNALRTELAAQIAQKTTGPALVGLTSDRTLTASEHHSDPDSEDDHHEWSNLLRHIRTRFGPLCQQKQEETSSELRFIDASQQTIRLLIVPRDSQGRRPATAQQLDYFCRRTPPADRDSVLLITNAIYAPYQFFAGALVLLQNESQRVELIGTSTTVPPATDLLYQRIAQEIHSAILTSTAAIMAGH